LVAIDRSLAILLGDSSSEHSSSLQTPKCCFVQDN